MRNSINASVFSLFYPFFNRKMAAILNFEIFFQFFFKRHNQTPEGSLCENLKVVGQAVQLLREEHTYTHTHIHRYPQSKQQNKPFSAIVIFTLIFELLLAVSNNSNFPCVRFIPVQCNFCCSKKKAGLFLPHGE